MERVEEDLATSPAKWKSMLFCRVRPWGRGDSITFSRNSLGQVGKRVSVVSSAVRMVLPFQTCLCVFAPFLHHLHNLYHSPCVDLNMGSS